MVLSEQGGDLYFEAQECVSAGRDEEAGMLSVMSGSKIHVLSWLWTVVRRSGQVTVVSVVLVWFGGSRHPMVSELTPW